jgi:uncharacterized protein YmfQ (DUF2313 family)
MRTAAEYTQALQALLPQGAAWSRDPDATLTQLLAGFAEAFARLDARALQVIEESDFGTADELLGEWEAVAGLPDPCFQDDPTEEVRRARLVQRLTSRGGQSIPYFKAVVAALGFECEIVEYQPFRAGRSVAGGRLSNGAWRFTFLVRIFVPELVPYDTGGVRCLITRTKPAHTVVLFEEVTEADPLFDFSFVD